MTHRPPKPRGPPFVRLANGPSTYRLSEDAFRPLLKHELMKGGVQGWEKMPDMTDSDPISFQFKGIKSDNDDYDLLGYVKAETLRGRSNWRDRCLPSSGRSASGSTSSSQLHRL